VEWFKDLLRNEFIPTPQLQLQMGDRLTAAGDEKSMEKVIEQLGNSMKWNFFLFKFLKKIFDFCLLIV